MLSILTFTAILIAISLFSEAISGKILKEQTNQRLAIGALVFALSVALLWWSGHLAETQRPINHMTIPAIAIYAVSLFLEALALGTVVSCLSIPLLARRVIIVFCALFVGGIYAFIGVAISGEL